MAKDITLKNGDGSMIYYPKTVSDLVYDNATGQTIKQQLANLSTTDVSVIRNAYVASDGTITKYVNYSSVSNVIKIRIVENCLIKGNLTFTVLAEQYDGIRFEDSQGNKTRSFSRSQYRETLANAGYTVQANETWLYVNSPCDLGSYLDMHNPSVAKWNRLYLDDNAFRTYAEDNITNSNNRITNLEAAITFSEPTYNTTNDRIDYIEGYYVNQSNNFSVAAGYAIYVYELNYTTKVRITGKSAIVAQDTGILVFCSSYNKDAKSCVRTHTIRYPQGAAPFDMTLDVPEGSKYLLVNNKVAFADTENEVQVYVNPDVKQSLELIETKLDDTITETNDNFDEVNEKITDLENSLMSDLFSTDELPILDARNGYYLGSVTNTAINVLGGGTFSNFATPVYDVSSINGQKIKIYAPYFTSTPTTNVAFAFFNSFNPSGGQRTTIYDVVEAKTYAQLDLPTSKVTLEIDVPQGCNYFVYCANVKYSSEPTAYWNVYYQLDLKDAFSEVDDKVNTLEEIVDNIKQTDLSDWTLYTIGDSLSTPNKYQNEIVELTNINFDGSKNNDNTYRLSAGGTNSIYGMLAGVIRTRNLVNSGWITNQGDKTIILFEQYNDCSQVGSTDDFDITAPLCTIEQVLDSSENKDNFANYIQTIPVASRKLGTVLKMKQSTQCISKRVRITNRPSTAGVVNISVGWTGNSNTYPISVSPSMTLAELYDKILEWDYGQITDTWNESEQSVDFSVHGTYEVAFTFTDTDNTGMAVSVESFTGGTIDYLYWFVGTSVSDWEDTTKWNENNLNWDSAMKSQFQLVQKNFPKAKVFWVFAPHLGNNVESITDTNGFVDVNAYYATNGQYNTVNWINHAIDKTKQACNLYGVHFLDAHHKAGMSPQNQTYYYGANNKVHPNNTGYRHFGDWIAQQIVSNLQK